MILAGAICTYCAGYRDLPYQPEDLDTFRYEQCPHCEGTGLEPDKQSRVVIFNSQAMEAAINATLAEYQRERG
jgi:hypothetical protein